MAVFIETVAPTEPADRRSSRARQPLLSKTARYQMMPVER
jgi:hypothetical protein